MTIWISLSKYNRTTSNSNERLVLSMGLSFIALVLFANLTKGQSSAMNDKFVFPLYMANSEDCDIKIEFQKMSFSRTALEVTMTTSYNETYINVLDELPLVMSLKHILSFNTTKVFTLTANETISPVLLRQKGDILQLLDLNSFGTSYLINIEDNHVITIIGTEDITSITIVNSDFSSNTTYTVHNGEVITYTPVHPGVFNIVASGKIGIVYSNVELSQMCDTEVDIVWEMLLPKHLAGNEFLLYIPEVQSAYLEVLGYENGLLELHSSDNITVFHLKAFEKSKIDISQTREVRVTTSVLVTLLCIVNLTIEEKGPSTNMFNVYPLVRSADCIFFNAINCKNTTCGFAVIKHITGSVELFDEDGVLIRELNSSNQQINRKLSGWKISGLSNGPYSIISKAQNEPLTMFSFNIFRGYYYQVLMSNRLVCGAEWTTDTVFHDTLDYGDTSTISNFSTASLIGTTGASNVNISHVTSLNISAVNQSAQTVPKTGSLHYFTSNSTAQNDTNIVSQAINNRLIFPFMYEEIPDDDSVLNEYLIAVIVSLCTAIFAVIAVISTFLLLEFLRRRRQIRNTKIRPFVS